MKEPVMFHELLRDWVAMPGVLDEAVAAGGGTRAETGVGAAEGTLGTF
jgi:hypothetical protein